jgi:hypothetical protein
MQEEKLSLCFEGHMGWVFCLSQTPSGTLVKVHWGKDCKVSWQGWIIYERKLARKERLWSQVLGLKLILNYEPSWDQVGTLEGPATSDLVGVPPLLWRAHLLGLLLLWICSQISQGLQQGTTEGKSVRNLLIGVNTLWRRGIRWTKEEAGEQRRVFSKELRPWLALGHESAVCQWTRMGGCRLPTISNPKRKIFLLHQRAILLAPAAKRK